MTSPTLKKLAVQRARRVRFRPSTDSMSPTDAHQRAQQDNLSLCTYTPSELKSIFDEAVDGIASLRAGKKFRNKFCERGLEHMLTPESYQDRKSRRKDATNAVLACQEAFTSFGDGAAEIVAEASRSATAACRREASERGRKDEREAEAIHYAEAERDTAHVSSSSSSRSFVLDRVRTILGGGGSNEDGSEDARGLLKGAMDLADSPLSNAPQELRSDKEEDLPFSPSALDRVRAIMAERGQQQAKGRSVAAVNADAAIESTFKDNRGSKYASRQGRPPVFFSSGLLGRGMAIDQ